MLKVALSHDVDRIRKTYQYLSKSGKWLLRFKIKSIIKSIMQIISNPYWGFDEIIKIENNYDVKSTFFFLNETIPFRLFKISNWKLSLGRYDLHEKKVSEIIKWLDENGWEIGVHGSYRSFQDKELLKKEKIHIEKILNHEIQGIRQHYMNLDGLTWARQHEVGFKYDSTWGLVNGIGFLEDRIRPFHPLNNEFCVIPITIMDSAFAETSRRWDKVKELIDMTQKHNSILVINWHTNNFNSTDHPGFKDNYIRLIELFKSMNAHFYKLSEYYMEQNPHL